MALAAFAVFLSVTTHNSVGSGVGAVVLVLLLRLASGLGLAGPLDPTCSRTSSRPGSTSPATP